MPGAWKDVQFENRNTNGYFDNIGERDLGLGIRFVFVYTPGDDLVTVIPPEGFFCYPGCEMNVAEDSTARVSLFSTDSVGM